MNFQEVQSKFDYFQKYRKLILFFLNTFHHVHNLSQILFFMDIDIYIVHLK